MKTNILTLAALAGLSACAPKAEQKPDAPNIALNF